ncbi:unannotated protein [freshwater metagenome]|uniref:Unannotated protein n=1 Tax=freshwater metagenome TaxID=449393 RepID=A0A6J7C2G1_9ZZZZ
MPRTRRRCSRPSARWSRSTSCNRRVLNGRWSGLCRRSTLARRAPPTTSRCSCSMRRRPRRCCSCSRCCFRSWSGGRSLIQFAVSQREPARSPLRSFLLQCWRRRSRPPSTLYLDCLGSRWTPTTNSPNSAPASTQCRTSRSTSPPSRRLPAASCPKTWSTSPVGTRTCWGEPWASSRRSNRANVMPRRSTTCSASTTSPRECAGTHNRSWSLRAQSRPNCGRRPFRSVMLCVLPCPRWRTTAR